jgi:hypothetical protein
MDFKRKLKSNEERQRQIWEEHNAPTLHCKLRAVHIRYSAFYRLDDKSRAKSDDLFDKVYQGTRIHNRSQGLVNMEILLANLISNQHNFFSISFNRNYWIKTQYRKPSATTIDLTKDLAREGLIEMHKGKGNDKPGLAYNTKIRATDRLLQHMKILPKEVLYVPPLIEVRGENKKLLPYRETIKTRRIKKILTQANEVNGKADIRHKDQELKTSMNAIFTEKTTLHGRLYTRGKHHQSLPEGERAKITINGDPVIEWDYSGFHPNLLYAKEGYQTWGEEGPYDRIFPDADKETKQFLKDAVLKDALLSLINARGCWSPKKPKKGQKQHWKTARLNAESGINQRIWKDNEIKKRIRRIYKFKTESLVLRKIEELPEIKKEIQTIQDARAILEEYGITTGEHIIEAFEKAHPKIAHYFCSENHTGMRLMNLDAQISLDVVNHFIKQNIPILPVHDSFIVQQQHSDELKETMLRCYRKHANGKWIKIK